MVRPCQGHSKIKSAQNVCKELIFLFLLTSCSLEMYIMMASNIPRSQHGPGKIDKGDIHVHGYNLQTDNVTCHGKKYRWGVYM